MYTTEEVQRGLNRLTWENAGKPAIIRNLARMCTGWPYVFGAWGAECTPANRRTYADRCRAKHADYADKIIAACPVLSGKQPACDGCQWVGCLCFDCRGYTHWLLEQAGLQLYGDTVSTQWETKSNWVLQGDISALPVGLAACLFRPGHTGMYLGDGSTSDCSTSVREGAMPGSPKWQQYGIPAGLYTNEELTAAGVIFDPARNVPTLRRGAKGALVEKLQTLLNAEDGAGLAVDGNFGAKTETAVKTFQSANGLKADGIVGPKTWAAIETYWDSEPMEGPIGDPEEWDEPEDETVPVPVTMLKMLYAEMREAEKLLKDLLEAKEPP